MASAIDPLLPPEIFADEAPLTDADLSAYFAACERIEDAGPAEGVNDGAYIEHEAPAVVRWSIGGPNEAAWAMAKYAEAEAAVADLDAQKNEYMLRIGYWFDNAAKDHQRSLYFFAGHLTRYAVDRRVASGGKDKSVKTPSGVVKTTADSDSVVIVDNDEVTTWAIEHAPDIVKRPAPNVLVSDVRTHVEIVDVPTRVVLSPCACVVAPTIPHDLKVWGRGNGVTCPQCNTDALVGDWLATEQVVVDDKGELVPGLVVREGTITAKVVTS